MQLLLFPFLVLFHFFLTWQVLSIAVLVCSWAAQRAVSYIASVSERLADFGLCFSVPLGLFWDI
jgi:hypothetical protein